MPKERFSSHPQKSPVFSKNKKEVCLTSAPGAKRCLILETILGLADGGCRRPSAEKYEEHMHHFQLIFCLL